MSVADEIAVREFASVAGHIAALAELSALHLQIDPDTEVTGEAMEGLGIMARRLSDALFNLADPNR